MVTRGDLTLGTSERIILETKPRSSQNYNFYNGINPGGSVAVGISKLLVSVADKRGQARLPDPELIEVEF